MNRTRVWMCLCVCVCVCTSAPDAVPSKPHRIEKKGKRKPPLESFPAVKVVVELVLVRSSSNESQLLIRLKSARISIGTHYSCR